MEAQIPYKGCILYGPYKRGNAQLQLIIEQPNKKRKTVLYARYLLEVSLGRLLTKAEKLGFKDNDPTNIALENLQIAKKYVGLNTFKCIICQIDFESKKKTRITCSRKCGNQYLMRRLAWKK